MPYIDSTRRQNLYSAINKMFESLRQDGWFEKVPSGDINYVFTEVLVNVLDLDTNPNYEKLNTAIGILECIKLELYRRIGAVYENFKSKISDTACYDRFDKWMSFKQAESQK